jgi:hypothetical protein
VTGIEAAVGLVVAWVVSKARRVGTRADAEVDRVLDASMDRLHDVVVAKLSTDTTVALHAEADRTGQISDGTREHMWAALRDAAGADPAFAEQVQALVRHIQLLQAQAGGVVMGEHGTAVPGKVEIHAEGGSAAAWNMGSVSVGGDKPDPPGPGQPVS